MAAFFTISAGPVLLGACYEEPPLEMTVLVRPDGSGTVSLAFNDVREVEEVADENELRRILTERTSGWRFPPDTTPYKMLSFEHFSVSRLPDGWRFDAWKYQDGLGTGGDGPLTLRLTLPGRLSAHNADSAKDGQLNWRIWLDSTAQLYAVTTGNDPHDDATSIWRAPPTWLFAGAIIVGLTVVVTFWRRRRRLSR